MRRLLFAAITLFALPCWAADAPARTYDFAYQVQDPIQAQGSGRIVLIQVFDDGQHTYLQFARPEPPPAIFAVTPGGQVLLTQKREGQFTVVARVERQLLITLGAARITVRYTGKGREDPPALFGTTTPIQSTGAVPTPVPADRIRDVRKVTPEPGAVPAVVATLPTTADPKPGATKAPRTEKTDTPPTPVPSPITTPAQLDWKVQPGETLLAVTRRWGKEAGLQVFWNRDPELTLMAGANFHGSIEDALKGLNGAIKDSGFSFHALLTGNSLIRITGEFSK